MLARSSAGGGLTVALLTALLLFAVPASARTGVSRPAAAKAALKALDVAGDADAVRVFGTLATVPSRTQITESALAGRAVADRRTGVQTGSPTAVLKTPGEPVWLFYADRGPHQGFAHPGQVVLVGARSGKVKVSRTLSWVPLVAGRLPAFFSSADGYEGKRFVVFDRPWPGAESAAPPLSQPEQATEAERRAAAALAAQHACVLRLSDTLGDFFDFGRVDETRAQLGRFFNRLARADAGFVTERYLPRLGRTPTAEAQRLIDKAGCRDLTLYAAGGAARGGSDAAVVIGLRARSGRVQWQTLTAAAIRKLLRANPGVSFKLIFDAPYTGRLATSLRGEPNLAVLLASGGVDEPSFLYLPSLTGPQGIVVNPGNPQHLLEFSNGLISGLGRFTVSPAEVDQGIAQTSTTFMAWMLARAANLAGSPFAGHLTSPVEILPGTTAPPLPAAPLPATPTTPGAVKPNHKPAGDTTPHSTDEDTAVSFTLGGTDEDGDPLSFEITSAPAHGTLDGTGPRVTYTPAPDYNGADQLSYRVSDGKDTSDPVTVALTVVAVNDAPVVTTSAGRASYTEQATPVAVDPGITLTDVDSTTIHGALVLLAPGADVLTFTNQNGITGNWNAAAGVLTLDGTATVADYQTALRSVAFSTPGDDPSTAVRTIRFRAEDGHATGTQTRELAVVAVDDPPLLATTAAGNAAYTEDGAPATADPDLALSDPDSATLNGATVTIASGLEADDRLDFTAASPITGSYASGVLTLSGTATTADYQAVLRSVKFRTVSENPSVTTRQLAVQAGGSNVLTRGMTVTRNDDAPAVATSNGNAAFTEGAAAAIVDGAVTATDPDSANLAGATVTITAPTADDRLAFTPPAGITGTYSAGVLTLTGSASVAAYQQTLRGVTYENTSDDPTTSRTLTFVVKDATSSSAPATRALTITPVNDAPKLTASSGSASYTENGSPVSVDPGLTVTDPDSAALTGATVTIGTGSGATDRLDFAAQSGITGGFAAGVLTLSGSASPSAYQAVLRSVTFESTGDNPGGATRTISFVAGDGTNSTPASRTVTVAPANDAPAVHTTVGTTPYPERAAAVTVDGALTVTDPDSADLTGATVTIKTGTQAGDALSFAAPPAGISGTVNAAGDTLSFTGTAPKAEYQTALRGVRFASSNNDPALARTIAFTVTDGSATSPEVTKNIAVSPVNDAPVLTTSTATTAYSENGGPIVIDGALAVTDSDSATLQSATVSIAANSQDVLSFANTANITGVYEAGVLTLTGQDSVAAYQTALRSVRYANTSDDPNPGARTISFRVTDGTDASDVATKTLSVTAVNDSPAVTTSAGATTFTEDGPPPVADGGVTVTDPDNANLTGATVSLSGSHAEDVLSLTDTATITGSFSGGVLTLTGTDTVANYQAALRAVRYSNSSQSPSTATRTVTFSVNDGTATGSDTKSLQVVAVNDVPALSPAGSVTFTENATATPAAGDAVAIAPDLVASDVDSANLTGATVEITGNRQAGEDVLSFADTATIAGAINAGKLTLSGTDTVANYQAALRSVRYRDTSNAPDTGARTIRFIATDGQDTSAPVDRTVTVVAVNDGPTATDKPFTGAIGNTTLRVGATPAVTGPSKDLAGNLTTGTTDPDSAGPFTVVPATAKATTGGGTVDLAADGSFVYHPKAGFTGGDTFAYTVSDNLGATGSATATIDVQNVVWYANPAAPAAGADGRSDHPFPSIGSVSAVSAIGQTIFAYSGTYTGGLTLKANQKLFSKRHGLTVGTTVLEAPGGSNAEIAGGVVLAADNTLQGIDFGAATGFALSGSAVGVATVDTLTAGKLDNPSGGAVGITGGGTLNVQLATLDASGNVSLTGTSGTFKAGTGALARVSLNGGTADLTLDASLSAATGRVVDITNQTGGTKDFNGAVSGGAVRLDSNAGATIRFDGPVTLSTGATDAFTATAGGTVVATAATNTLDTTTGRALNVTATKIGAAGLTFQRISTNGAPQGIVLSGTDTLGKLTVTGNGGTCTKAGQSGCSGGTIANGTGSDDAGSTPAGTGIVLNNTLAPSFTRVYLHDFSNYAIRGSDVAGLTLADSVVSGINGSNGNSPYREGSVRFDNLTGSASIARSFIGGGIYDNLRVTNDAGTLDRLTVQGSEIGANGSLGNDGINVESLLGTNSTMNVTVDQTTFTSAAGDLFQATIDGNGGGDVKLTGNTLSNNHPAIASGVGGVTLEGARGGNTTMTVTGNTLRDAKGQALLITKGQGNRTLSGTVANNAIGVAAIANSGSLEGNGIEVDSNGGGKLSMSVTNNQLRQYNGDGIHLQAGAGVVDAGQLSVAVSGNTLSNPGTNPAIGLEHQGLHLNSGVTPGDNFDVCLDLGPNSMTGSGTHGGTDFRLRQRFDTGVKLLGYTGGAIDTAAVTSYVQSKLGGAPTGVASSDPAGEGFTGGSSCP